MNKLQIIYKDNVKCQYLGLTNEDRNILYNKYRVFIPSARFMPAYKIGKFDGYINYFQLTGVTYISFMPEIEKLIDLSKYDIEIIDKREVKDIELIDHIDKNYFYPQKWYEGHRLEGQDIELEEHQVRMVNHLLNHPRCVFSASTSAGKTIVSAVLLNELSKKGKCVIVVPSKDLCIQSCEEYIKLGLDAGIVGCGRREFNHKIIVCTWQTIHSIDKRKKEDTLSYEELSELRKGTIGIIFDECFDGDTLITLSDNTLKKIKDCNVGDKIISYNEKEKIFEEDVIVKKYKNMPISSPEDMYEIEMEDGNIIKVTGNHKILTLNGWKEVKELNINDEIVSYDK